MFSPQSSLLLILLSILRRLSVHKHEFVTLKSMCLASSLNAKCIMPHVSQKLQRRSAVQQKRAQTPEHHPYSTSPFTLSGSLRPSSDLGTCPMAYGQRQFKDEDVSLNNQFRGLFTNY